MVIENTLSEKYRISVIVPIYNIESYLPHCIESIIDQTYHHLQIILVDDGSTDTSGQICDRYAQKDTRIQVIHKKNEGPTAARKSGLREANGEFVGFVDGDDFIEATFYETLLKNLLDSQSDFVHTGYISEKNSIRMQQCLFESNVYDLNTNIAADIINKYILLNVDGHEISPSLWSKLFKNEFIQNCYSKVPDEITLGEDLCCLCICLLQGRRVYFHKIALYHYNLRNNSITNSVSPAIISKILKLYIALQTIFRDYGISQQTELNLNTFIIRGLFSSLNKSSQYINYISAFNFADMDLVKGKKIVIYAAGIVGQGYYAQLRKYTSCEIVGWVDKNYKNVSFDFVDVNSVEDIQKMQYDIILIAVESKDIATEIRIELKAMGIPDNKILWRKPKPIA